MDFEYNDQNGQRRPTSVFVAHRNSKVIACTDEDQLFILYLPRTCMATRKPDTEYTYYATHNVYVVKNNTYCVAQNVYYATNAI